MREIVVGWRLKSNDNNIKGENAGVENLAES